MIFTSGLVAELMVPFAMTISYALTASLVVALTVVPTAGSIMLKKTKEKAIRSLSGYRAYMASCLRFACGLRLYRLRWLSFCLLYVSVR